jgi:formylglycine-generating enzyme required for sulfatase activity
VTPEALMEMAKKQAMQKAAEGDWEGAQKILESARAMAEVFTGMTVETETTRKELTGVRTTIDVTLNAQAEDSVAPVAEVRAGTRKLVRVGWQEVAMRWCPAGTFTMGSPGGEAGRYDDETQHRVTLTRGFWMGETEVRQGLWRDVMGENPSCFMSGDNYPVENVSWNDCQAFVQALNARYPQDGLRWALPTEAQWEYACRAGTGTALPNGKDIRILGDNNAPALDDIAWYGGNSSVNYGGSNGVDTSGWPGKQYPGGKAGTHPVGGKKANAWGLYDMIGNVWEWCADWYGPYPSGLVTDPTGSGQGSNRVGRGGSWYSYARLCRSALRGDFDPGGRINFLGLRLALLPAQ